MPRFTVCPMPLCDCCYQAIALFDRRDFRQRDVRIVIRPVQIPGTGERQVSVGVTSR